MLKSYSIKSMLTLSQIKFCLYIPMSWVCASLSLKLACLSEWKFFKLKCLKVLPRASYRSRHQKHLQIARLLSEDIFFCLCDPYFQQGELLLIYSKRFTFVILKINHRLLHLKMSLGITFGNPWPWNMIFIYSMNRWPSNKFWNEDI